MHSIIPGDRKEVCYDCRRYCQTHEHHILEGSCRQKSEEFGLKVHLCPYCHELIHHAKGKNMRDEYHKMAQTEYEELMISRGMTSEEARKSFIENFIRSYL